MNPSAAPSFTRRTKSHRDRRPGDVVGNPPSNAGAPFLARHLRVVLTILAASFILLTGLTPFDIRQAGAATGSYDFFTTTINRVTFPDTVANIFLYVPFGFLLGSMMIRWSRGRFHAWLFTAGVCALLSGAIEWVQAYSPARVSSLIDFSANLTGGAIGGLISLVTRSLGPRLTASAFAELSAHPATTVLKAYCSILIVIAAAPFSFVLDSGSFAREVKTAHYVPFASMASHEAAATSALEEGANDRFALAKWQSLRCWSRWAAEGVSFAILGWLTFTTLRRNYAFSQAGTMAISCWIGVGMAVGLSLLHLIVLTRDFDVTDILFRLIGLTVALVTAVAVTSVATSPGAESGTRIDATENHPPRLSDTRYPARLGFFATALYIIYTGVIPLTFDTQSAGPAQAMAADAFVPFHAYFYARFDVMMTDVMEKFIAYGLLAVLAVTGWPGLMRRATLPRLTLAAVIAAAGSACIEIVQMFIPIRVTSLTDPILAACGTVIGLVCYEHGVAFYRYAIQSAACPQQQLTTARDTRRLAPADELIATLTEPSENAPREPEPTRHPTRSR